MKRNNNRYNNNTLNRNNLVKSNGNFGMTLSNSINRNFNTINNNIRESKEVKIKNITKKNNKPKPVYNKKEKKEKEHSEDNRSDYGNASDDDFNNILRESMSIQSLNTSNTNRFTKNEKIKEKSKINEKLNENNSEDILYNKINEHFKKENDYINRYQTENIKQEDDNKEKNNIFFDKPNTITNKSINIDDYINQGKKEININENNNNNNKINNSLDEELEKDLLKNNNIFNNKTNIINLKSNNQQEPNYNSDELKKESKIENNSLEQEDSKNRLINHNMFIDKKLKEMKFLEKLKEISDSRYLFFKNKYRKDNNFLEENSFENILITEKNLKIQSPLTLIFQKIFSPDNPKYPYKKNFFEKIFSSGDNMNYISYYDQTELNKVPKFFNDLSYVNNLFNSFDFDELNNFIEEILTWKNIFSYEQEYTHQIKYFKQKKYVTLKNKLTIYFISPYDLIIDYHSRSSGIPFSDTVMAINQFIFHSDIKFDSKKGKFQFKTSVKILNSIKIVKNTAINNTIREEGKNENDEEIINNVWIPMKKEILEQDILNQQQADEIYNNYLKNNLKNYSNIIPKENNDIKIKDNDSEDVWDSFSQNSNENNENDYYRNYYINQNKNMDELNKRNSYIIKGGAYALIGIYLIKIFFSSFSFDTIIGIFWISLIGYLMYKFR